MSEAQLIEVIGRAVVDPEFRESLINKPEKAIEKFDLMPEEIELFKRIKPESIEFISNELEERVSRAGLNISDGALMIQMDQMGIQEAMNRDAQNMQLISEIMKNKHDVIKSIIRNIRS